MFKARFQPNRDEIKNSDFCMLFSYKNGVLAEIFMNFGDEKFLNFIYIFGKIGWTLGSKNLKIWNFTLYYILNERGKFEKNRRKFLKILSIKNFIFDLILQLWSYLWTKKFKITYVDSPSLYKVVLSST